MVHKLKHYLKEHIINMYQQFDMAHQKDHVYKVIENSLDIAKDYKVNIDMVYVIACYHDIGMQYGRKDHHITGGQFLYDDLFLMSYFNQESRNIMKEAIEDHRASKETPPRSIYGKIIAEADRDINPDTIIKRTVQFGFKHYPNIDETQHIQRAYDHIADKYGPKGYLQLWLETQKNRQGLNKIHELLLNKKELFAIIKGHYDNLK